MKNKLFTMVLEESSIDPNTIDTANTTVHLIGPLSEAYTQALAVAFNSENTEANADGNTVVSVESQAIDIATMAKLSRMLNTISNNNSAPTDNFQKVYGVAKTDVNEQTVVDVTHELAEASDNGRKDEFIMIVDATAPTPSGVEVRSDLISTLESLVHCHGGKVFSSLEEFAKSL